MAEQRKIALFAEVHKVVRYLHDEGKCPIAERVTSLLSPTTSKERKTANAAVKAARRAGVRKWMFRVIERWLRVQ
jgi:hypothetical protein